MILLLKNLVRQTRGGLFSVKIAVHFAEYTVLGETISAVEFREKLSDAIKEAIPLLFEEKKTEKTPPLEQAISNIVCNVFYEVSDYPTNAEILCLKNVTFSGHGEPINLAFWRGDIASAKSFSLLPEPQPG